MLPVESLSISLSTFTLIALAEIGDKSQLVCMTLAARHRHWPVILGAAVAFVVLNTLQYCLVQVYPHGYLSEQPQAW